MTREFLTIIGGVLLLLALVCSIIRSRDSLIVIAFLILSAAAARAEWVTPNGKAFHTRRACIALRTTTNPQEITRAEAEKRGLHICGICSRTKKGTK